MQLHMVKAKIIAQWMDMHLTYALGLVAMAFQLPCHCMGIIPVHAVSIAHAAVALLAHPRVEGGPGRYTGGAGTICPVKQRSSGCQSVQKRRLDIRVPHTAQTVSPELVSHYENNVFWFHIFFQTI